MFDRIDTNDKVLEEIENDLGVEFAVELNQLNILHISDYSPKVTVKLENIHVDEGWLDDFDLDIINAVKYNLGMEFEGGNHRQFLKWIDELSRNHGTPTFKQLKFIEDIEDETGETFRGFTKEADANASMRDALIKIDLIADSSNHGYKFEPLFNRLADIVDPTCRIYWTDTSYDTPDTGYVSDGYYSCSHCHCEFGDYTSEVWDTYQASYYEGEPPFEFCPHCGARIIIDEPRKDDRAN